MSPSIKPPSEQPAIRVVMMPRDVNANGSIFGGIILSYMDQAGFVEAMRQCPGKYVTIAMDKVEFHKPVFVGDIVSFFADTTRIGRTSITVHVTVKCDHRNPEHAGTESAVVTEAQLVYVCIDDDHRPTPIHPA